MLCAIAARAKMLSVSCSDFVKLTSRVAYIVVRSVEADIKGSKFSKLLFAAGLATDCRHRFPEARQVQREGGSHDWEMLGRSCLANRTLVKGILDRSERARDFHSLSSHAVKAPWICRGICVGNLNGAAIEAPICKSFQSVRFVGPCTV